MCFFTQKWVSFNQLQPAGMLGLDTTAKQKSPWERSTLISVLHLSFVMADNNNNKVLCLRLLSWGFAAEQAPPPLQPVAMFQSNPQFFTNTQSNGGRHSAPTLAGAHVHCPHRQVAQFPPLDLTGTAGASAPQKEIKARKRLWQRRAKRVRIQNPAKARSSKKERMWASMSKKPKSS